MAAHETQMFEEFCRVSTSDTEEYHKTVSGRYLQNSRASRVHHTARGGQGSTPTSPSRETSVDPRPDSHPSTPRRGCGSTDTSKPVTSSVVIFKDGKYPVGRSRPKPSNNQDVHHKRGLSRREMHPRRPHEDVDNWDYGESRPRVHSMPCRNTQTPFGGGHYRLRSFTITPRGVVDDGDCYVKRSSSATSSGDCTPAEESHTGSTEKHNHVNKVMLLGSTGVGKRTLIELFRKENNMHICDTIDENQLSILLDGEQSTIEFIEVPDEKQFSKGSVIPQMDAFVVVYSVKDRGTFETAINNLYTIRDFADKHVAVILVANKTDLIRSRLVDEHEGKAAANTYDAKYIEVSVAMDHKIDELLVGILKQIRLNKKQFTPASSRHRNRDCCMWTARENVLANLFDRDKRKVSSCDNLYVL